MENPRIFDFHRIFFGELPYSFLLEIVLRTLIMYTYTIVLLRVLGKRNMGQLSTLELAIIICFGSAVGDPMMGVDIPIVHGMVVITSVALLQLGAEWLINKNSRLEGFMEGSPDCIVKDGVMLLQAMAKNNLSREDVHRFLRGKEVEQLGEVKKAFFETSGMMSVWCFSPADVLAGLDITPLAYIANESILSASVKVNAGHYSCMECGLTLYAHQNRILGQCTNCGGGEWLPAVMPKIK